MNITNNSPLALRVDSLFARPRHNTPVAEEVPAGEAAPAPTPAKPATTPAASAEKKVELTQEQLDKLTADAIRAHLDKTTAEEAEKKRIEKEARDKEKGEFKALYEAEQKKAADAALALEKAKADIRAREIAIKLRDTVATKHPDYANAVKYMQPLVNVAADADDAAIGKAIDAVVAEYVKDNPRTPKPGTLQPVARSSNANPRTVNGIDANAIAEHSRMF